MTLHSLAYPDAVTIDPLTSRPQTSDINNMLNSLPLISSSTDLHITYLLSPIPLLSRQASQSLPVLSLSSNLGKRSPPQKLRRVWCGQDVLSRAMPDS